MTMIAISIAALTIPRQTLAADADPGNVALAQHIAENGRAILSGKVITKQHFQMSAAMLEAACRLDPEESRYPRLLTDALLQARDTDGAIKALKAYVKLEDDDKGAKLQLIDLYANSYETEDKRLDYLRDWVDDTRVPEEVRSHIAWRAFQSYNERAQTAKAKAMLDLSLKLNPLNLDALRSRYVEVADGTPFERITTLLAMLKSNPAQSAVLTNLAQELAAMGLAQPSAEFYNRAVTLAGRTGGVPREVALNFAVELVLANQLPPAKQLTDYLTKTDPGDYEALVVRLLIERAAEPKDAAQKDAVAKTTQQAQNVLLNRLQMVRQSMGDRLATTRPVESAGQIAWGSPGDDVRKMNDLKPEIVEPIRRAYIDAAGEIAWFQLYFVESPADAKPFMDALKELLTDQSPLLPRLEGWGFLDRHDNGAAKVKLSAVKEKDPLAELGLIKMMDADAAQKEGNKLLAGHPSGLTSVLILDALRDRKVALTPSAATVGPVMEVLTKFPMDWFTIMDHPQDFYILKAEPLKLAHAYGEPMFIRVTITNKSEYPITVGDDGVLHPDLWFDAQFRGNIQKGVAGAAFDRMRREIVLKPRGSMSQVVRVDQGAVAQTLISSPFPAMQILFQVRTNPSQAQTLVGPAGQVVQAMRSIQRLQFPLPNVNTLDAVLTTAGPAEKIRNLDLALNIAVILSQQQNNPQATQLAQHLGQLIQGATRDSSPAVQTWAAALLAGAAIPQERLVFVGKMMGDPQWCTRLMGLASMGTLTLADQKTYAARAAKDTDPTVAAFAAALSELVDMVQAGVVPPPATNPTTAPATAPTAAPAGPATAPTAPVPVVSMPPASAPTSRPTGSPSDLVIPSLPLVLPPAGPATVPAAPSTP